MAKKSKIAKNKRQHEMVTCYAPLRKKLKEQQDFTTLNKLPKNSSPVRIKNRCEVTGRPRGYMRKFNMSRIVFRELAHKGQLPGVKKASW